MSKERTPARRNTFTLSLILGLLLIPVSAVAALALVDRTVTDDDALAAASAEPLSAVTTVVAANAAAEPTTEADLAIACGDEGWALVEKEIDGSINGLEQAALDALRGICESAGMPLAGPPAPAPIVRTVRITTPAPTAPPVEPAPVDASDSVEPILPADTAADFDEFKDDGADNEDDAVVPDDDHDDDHDEDDEDDEDEDDEEDEDHHEDDDEDEER